MPDAEPLSRQEIEQRLSALPGWQLTQDDGTLQRTYHLAHLPAAIFVVHVAGIQDELNHHSDLTLGYDSVTVAITTHAAGARLTTKDFDLADRVEAIAAGHGAR